MSNYSDDSSSCRVDFFKPSGKWCATEAVRFTSSWEEDPKTALTIALRAQFGERFSDMTAVCLEPYVKHSFPVMVRGWNNPQPPGRRKVKRGVAHYTPTGADCGVCGEPLYRSPGGPVCSNGHGAPPEREAPRDPSAPCILFKEGEPSGDCSGDGHYRCSECRLFNVRPDGSWSEWAGDNPTHDDLELGRKD